MGGCCEREKENKSNDSNRDLDFEEYRNQLKNGTNKIYEVEASLFEYTKSGNNDSNGILINKYLFFESTGRFSSKIKHIPTQTNINIDGNLDRSGKISLVYKSNDSENKEITTYYEGQIQEDYHNESKGLFIKGNVYRDIGSGKTLIENTEFLLRFEGEQWKITQKNENQNFNNIALINYKHGIFSGISKDEKGLSLIAGLETSNKIESLVQIYIDKNNSAGATGLDDNTYVYSGSVDKINNVIEGEVTNKSLESNTTFVMTYLGKNLLV